MACIPVYKGKKFNSTEELEAYLRSPQGIMQHLSDGSDTEFISEFEQAVQMAEGVLSQPINQQTNEEPTPTTEAPIVKETPVPLTTEVVEEGQPPIVAETPVDANKGQQKKKIWMRGPETSLDVAKRAAESLAKESEQYTFIDKNGESTEVTVKNNNGKWEWFYEKSKKPFASFDTPLDAIKYILKQPFWDNGTLNKEGRNDEHFAKNHSDFIELELKNGNIYDDIVEGLISPKDAIGIIENSGLEVPKKIKDLADAPTPETKQEAQSPFTSFSQKGEQGRKARAELKNRVGKEQYKLMEEVNKKAPDIFRGLEKDGKVEIICP